MGSEFRAKVVVIAAGGGSFTPKRPPLAGIEPYEGKSVLYSVRRMEDFRDKDVLVVGGGDSALDWTLNLQPRGPEPHAAAPARRFPRRAPLRGADARPGGGGQGRPADRPDVGAGRRRRRADGVIVKTKEGETRVAVNRLLPFFGLTMKLGPVADWGLNLHENLIKVDTEKFETGTPGIFAIGDINWYPGKLKLILSGFHEAALMSQAAHRIVYPGKKLLFQYTTSSSSLQKKLGVS